MVRNKFEKKLNNQLKKSKIRFNYESLRIPYILSFNYIPDWHVIPRPGCSFIIEGKGWLRPEDKRKLIAVKRQHPDLDIRIVFQSRNKKYIRWAEKYGFKYAVGSIPSEWLTGQL